MGDPTTPTHYEKSWTSDFFHSFPHLNRHMSKVNSNFEPDEAEYREALVIWGLVPVAFCVVLWVFFFVFFICRCCEKTSKPTKSPSLCPRVTTGLFIFFAVGLLSFGLYENEEAHRGVDQFRVSVIEINTTVGGTVKRLDLLNNMATDVSGRLSENILEISSKFPSQLLKRQIASLVKKIQDLAFVAQKQINEVDLVEEFSLLKNIIDVTHEVEYYRWAGSIVVSCIYIFIFFLTLIGLLIRSRTLLILATSLCVFCLLFLWIYAGAHLGSSVGLGDLCVDPDNYVINIPEDPKKKAIIRAYVQCANDTEPYRDEIQGSIKSLTQAQLVVDTMQKLLNPLQLKLLNKPFDDMKVDLQYSIANLSIMLDNVGLCTNLHNHYEDAVGGACNETLTATAWITLAACVVGIFCIFTIVSNSMLWRQYAKKRLPNNFNQVDDTDPFLPRPPPYESDYGAVGYSSPTPWSERGTLQRYNTDSPYSDESLMMLPHTQRHAAPLPVDESPPPAYHPGRFVRQYAASENH